MWGKRKNATDVTRESSSAEAAKTAENETARRGARGAAGELDGEQL